MIGRFKEAIAVLLGSSRGVPVSDGIHIAIGADGKLWGWRINDVRTESTAEVVGSACKRKLLDIGAARGARR